MDNREQPARGQRSPSDAATEKMQRLLRDFERESEVARSPCPRCGTARSGGVCLECIRRAVQPPPPSRTKAAAMFMVKFFAILLLFAGVDSGLQKVQDWYHAGDIKRAEEARLELSRETAAIRLMSPGISREARVQALAVKQEDYERLAEKAYRRWRLVPRVGRGTERGGR